MADPDAVYDEDDAEDPRLIVGFEAEQKARLGKAPAWANHLHDCLHATNREVQRLRHRAANREMAVDKLFKAQDKKLDKIILLLGEESEDGESGRGFIGIALRNRKRIERLEGDRNIFRGALLAFAAAAAALGVFFKAWVESLIPVGK